MNLNEDEKRMVYQIESTNQVAALNEIYMPVMQRRQTANSSYPSASTGSSPAGSRPAM